MTPEQRASLTNCIWGDAFTTDKYALEACLKERDAFEAIVRRVHAECGPRKHMLLGDQASWFVCLSCSEKGETKADIPHPKDCLWFAVDCLQGVQIPMPNTTAVTPTEKSDA